VQCILSFLRIRNDDLMKIFMKHNAIENQCANIKNKLLGMDRDIALALAGSILFPLLLTAGGWFVAIDMEQTKRKAEMIKDFSQSYSDFISNAEEMYYLDCVHHSNGPIEDEECKKYENIEHAKDCERMVLKKRILNIKQPDGLLTQIGVIFKNDKTRAVSDNLLDMTSVITQSLSCNKRILKDSDAFDKKIEEADKAYKSLLQLMSHEL